MKRLIALFLLASTPAIAATPCDGIWQKPLPAGETLLNKSGLQKKGIISKPKVFEVMQSSGWSLVWAEFTDAEPGGYFLQGERHITTWGGMAAGETDKEIASWALKQNKAMPPALARCFGWYVVTGREQGPPTRPNPFNRR
jgi:hypothetical protein